MLSAQLAAILRAPKTPHAKTISSMSLHNAKVVSASIEPLSDEPLRARDKGSPTSRRSTHEGKEDRVDDLFDHRVRHRPQRHEELLLQQRVRDRRDAIAREHGTHLASRDRAIEQQPRDVRPVRCPTTSGRALGACTTVALQLPPP